VEALPRNPAPLRLRFCGQDCRAFCLNGPSERFIKFRWFSIPVFWPSNASSVDLYQMPYIPAFLAGSISI